MKILLTSNGLTSEKLKKDFLNLLEKPIKQNKVILMFGVQNEEEMKYVCESKEEIIGLGILKENIIEVNFSKKVDIKKLNDFDIIYFCGGNTYYILDRIRKTGLDHVIKKAIKQNKIYIGVSAGSIIIGPSIEIAGWGSEGDTNEVAIKDLEGFNFTNIVIFPHYKDSLKKEVEGFKKKTDYEVKALKDDEGLLIK